jgi:hypothetical protein
MPVITRINVQSAAADIQQPPKETPPVRDTRSAKKRYRDACNAPTKATEEKIKAFEKAASDAVSNGGYIGNLIGAATFWAIINYLNISPENYSSSFLLNLGVRCAFAASAGIVSYASFFTAQSFSLANIYRNKTGQALDKLPAEEQNKLLEKYIPPQKCDAVFLGTATGDFVGRFLGPNAAPVVALIANTVIPRLCR